MLAELTQYEFCLLIIASIGVGLSKSGFPGISMLHVIVFAMVFGTKASTGILLPILIVGDICAVIFFGKKAQWDQVRRLLPPTLIGVILGTLLMAFLSEQQFKPIVGTIILVLTVLQIIRMWRPSTLESVPHNIVFAWSLGLLAGVTTMLANAAGPIVALYLLAIAAPKMELVGTSAWMFLIINIFKIPFSSLSLGLIDLQTLTVDLVFTPAVPIGMFLGRWMLEKIPQKLFNSVLLALTVLATLRLIGLI